MKYAELLARVPDEWHDDFVKFITTGNAGDTFFDFLDRDRGTQEAVEAALAAQVRSFERSAGDRNIDPKTIAAYLTRSRATLDPVHEASSKLTSALLRSSSLQHLQRKDVVRNVAAALSRADRPSAIQMLDEIRKSLS